MGSYLRVWKDSGKSGVLPQETCARLLFPNSADHTFFVTSNNFWRKTLTASQVGLVLFQARIKWRMSFAIEEVHPER